MRVVFVIREFVVVVCGHPPLKKKEEDDDIKMNLQSMLQDFNPGYFIQISLIYYLLNSKKFLQEICCLPVSPYIHCLDISTP